MYVLPDLALDCWFASDFACGCGFSAGLTLFSVSFGSITSSLAGFAGFCLDSAGLLAPFSSFAGASCFRCACLAERN